MSYSSRAKQHGFSSGAGGLEPLEKKILKYMQDHGSSPLPIRSIVNAIGSGKTKKEINKVLYNLQKKRLVEKIQESNPPTWILLRGNSPSPLSSLVTPSTSSPSQDDKSSEPIPLPRKLPKANTQVKKDDFEVPPTPQDLLNDVNSQFSKITVKDQSLPTKDIEEKLISFINAAGSISKEELYRCFFGEHNFDKALQSLLANNKIAFADDQYFTLVPNGLNKLKDIRETLPQKNDEETCVMYDFTSDCFDSHPYFPEAPHTPVLFAPSMSTLPTVPTPSSRSVPLTIGISRPSLSVDGKNAISVLNEYAQSRQSKVEYDEEMCGPDHKPQFWMTVFIGGQSFKGPAASTKKDAKLKAAEVALAHLFSTGKLNAFGGIETEALAANIQEDASIHEKVAALVEQKYNELALQLPDTIVGRKIIAGFVMTRNVKSGETLSEVVSIGSGNRCVMGDKLSLHGQTVNDCHAEIIARRGLVRFLYKKLLSQDKSIFLSNNGRFQLCPGIEFHLYISTAPCGDSAIFAPSDLNTDQENQTGSDGGHHPLFQNKKQGVLRTKVENGEGCIPIDEDTAAPTWDGILRGERLRTMSCSDKIAKWNFVGLQGSLLSHFLEKPIYMSSLTLGMLYNHGHLTRAVCCRVQRAIECLDDDQLPASQYRVHHPSVAGLNHVRETGKIKTREYSLNWSFGDEKPEVLDGTTGRCEIRFQSVDPPRICKSELFKLYKELSCKMNLSTRYGKSYLESKTSASNYQATIQIFWNALERSGFGKWMSKPTEEKDF